MGTLVAIAYPDVATAGDRSAASSYRRPKEHLIQLEDAVVVEPRAPTARWKLHRREARPARAPPAARCGAASSACLFLAPLFGMAIGAAAGAAAGKMTDVGVDDNFLKTLGAKLTPGGAALIMLGRSETPDRVIERVKQYGGEVVQTSLSEDDEAHLRAALGETTTAG